MNEELLRDLRAVRMKMKALEAERAGLIVSLEKLKKIAESRVGVLESEVGKLRREVEKKAWTIEPGKISVPSRLRYLADYFGWIVLLCGAVVVPVSVFLSSALLALVGLLLVFWGGILAFLRRERYVKASLVEAVLSSLLKNLEESMAGLGCEGQATYLPPKLLENDKSGLVFVSKDRGSGLSVVERRSAAVSVKSAGGVFVRPVGLGLVNAFERELGRGFEGCGLKYLERTLPRLLVKDLRLADGFSLEVRKDEFSRDVVRVVVENSVFRNVCLQVRESSGLCNTMGCPLCSAVACALVRAMDQPVVVDGEECSKDCGTVSVQFVILGEGKREGSWSARRVRANLT